jgi:hypothetical protein
MVIYVGKLHLRLAYNLDNLTFGVMMGEASPTCIGITIYLLPLFIHLGYGK